MKTAKRILSLGLAALLVASMSVSAFAAIDKNSTRKLKSRTDSGEAASWNNCIYVAATVPGIKDEIVFGIIPDGDNDYSDRARVEKVICIYVSGALRGEKKEQPIEFTYTIKFPEGMETPAWASEPVLTLKDPQWIEYSPEK